MTQEELKQLVEAVAAWLQFEVLCEREKYLSESALNYPLVQFFQSHGCRLWSEYPFPGTKRLLVDYAYASRVRAQKPEGYIEVKRNALNFDSLLNDIVRLVELRKPGGNRFFLFVWTDRDDFRKKKPRRRIDPFLSLDTDKPLRRIDTATRNWKRFAKARKVFANKFLDGTRSKIHQFKTRLVGLDERSLGRAYITVAMWKITLR